MFSEHGPMPDGDLDAKNVGVKRMLAELAFPAGALRPEHRELEDHAITALDPLLELLSSVDRTTHGKQDYGVRVLLARALSDIVASLHLVTHGYLNQAYGSMRTAYEALDLVELLAGDPKEAELWVDTEHGHIDFRPGAVRKRLGKERHDPTYSQLSELSHPRFAASKLASFGLQEEGTDELRVRVRIGPFLIDETADAWLAAGFLVPLIGILSVQMGALAKLRSVPERAWDDALTASHAGVASFGTLVGKQLLAFGLDAEGFAAEFEKTPEIIAKINEEYADERRGGDDSEPSPSGG
jgi:hypothetical protein